jgi:lipid II:glycine glycyltransferase (peptidoglycan interpeptide bridge formation enzyme)
LTLRLLRVDQRDQWDAALSALPGASALQAWGWGEVKRLSRWTPERFLLVEEGVPVAAAQVLTQGLTSAGPVVRYSPRGPALRDPGRLEPLADCLRVAWGPGTLFWKIEPEIDGGVVAPGFRVAESLQPEATFIVSLEGGEEAVLARAKSKTRYNARLAQRHGVTAGLEEDFETFWRLFEETNRRARLLQHSREYYAAVLRECGRAPGFAGVFTARLEGEPLASVLVVGFGGTLYYLYGGSSRQRQEVMAPYLAHLAVIRHGLANGYRAYDLWGIPRDDAAGRHSAGIYRFKAGWGGRRVHYPAADLPLSSAYDLVRLLLRARKSLRNLLVRGSARDVL